MVLSDIASRSAGRGGGFCAGRSAADGSSTSARRPSETPSHTRAFPRWPATPVVEARAGPRGWVGAPQPRRPCAMASCLARSSAAAPFPAGCSAAGRRVGTPWARPADRAVNHHLNGACRAKSLLMTYLVRATDDEINEVSYAGGTIEEARAAVIDLTKRAFSCVVAE